MDVGCCVGFVDFGCVGVDVGGFVEFGVGCLLGSVYDGVGFVGYVVVVCVVFVYCVVVGFVE